MATREPLFDRDSSLHVTRGLYLLRYEARGGSHNHPFAIVAPEHGFEDRIQVISAPGGAQGRLDQPGAAVLVRAEGHGKIKIGVKRKGSGGSLDATFRLESVGLVSNPGPSIADPVEFSQPASNTQPASRLEAPDDAVLVAHVSRRGDVPVKANEWVGGPEAPARIEGITLLGFGQEDVRGEIQFLSSTRRAWSDWVCEGVFVGTRGRSEPVLGVRLRLVGDQASHFIMQAEALFLGSAIMVKRGREIECVSESGRDPLVGLRLGLGPERRASVRSPASTIEREERPRVRIFRADER